MGEDIIERAEAYAASRGRSLAGRLGFGIHGMVFLLEGNADCGVSAVKIHQNLDPDRRERDIYERLAERDVISIGDFTVPQMIGHNDVLFAIEMTLVQPPFVLDFAGASLDWPPELSEEVWAERLEKLSDEIGADWQKARSILDELEASASACSILRQVTSAFAKPATVRKRCAQTPFRAAVHLNGDASLATAWALRQVEPMNWHGRITHDPGVMGGKPCIRGIRVTARLEGPWFMNGRTLVGVRSRGSDENRNRFPRSPDSLGRSQLSLERAGTSETDVATGVLT